MLNQCLLGLSAWLPLSGFVVGTASLVEAPVKKWCLVQSSRSLISARQQPLQGTLPPNVATGLPDLSQNDTGINVTNGTSRSAADALYDLSVSSFARLAYSMALHWPTILVVFCMSFGVVFPFLHWVFEDRKEERKMFIQHDTEDAPVGTPTHRSASIKHIHINLDGGLGKVSTLIEVDRPRLRRMIKVITYLGAISFNVFMLVQQDVTMLVGAVGYYNGDEKSQLPSMLKKYLEFNGNVSLISVRHAVCVAIAELLGLGAMVIWIIYRFSVFHFCKKSNDAKFDAFLGLHDAFEGVGQLGGFSALRLVSLAHPALIVRQFQYHMERPFLGGNSPSIHTMQFVYFVITRSVAIILGVMAFGVKLAFTSVQVHMPLVGDNWLADYLWTWCVVIMLLEQTLGAVGVEHVMWWRVMLLVVEGGDRQITLHKIQIANVYLSRIMQCIYEEYWCKGNYRQFLVLMLTFDHIDLQHLLIDEGLDLKPPIAAATPQTEEGSGLSGSMPSGPGPKRARGQLA